MKNNILKLLGLFLFCLFFSIGSQTANAQTTRTPCLYAGRMQGCDFYGCGECIMVACGAPGGVLVCPE